MDYAGYEDPYYSNYEAAPAIEYYGTPQSVGNLTELFGTTPQSTTTTQPSWWDAIPSGEARYAPADPREALQQRMLEAQVALMEKQAGIGQQNQRELAPWQSWIKDNQGALSLGLGALTLLDKLNQQKQDKKQQSFVRMCISSKPLPQPRIVQSPKPIKSNRTNHILTRRTCVRSSA